jgi:hypothetical protein
MAAVVDLHGGRVNVGLKGSFVVGKRRQCVRHKDGLRG